MPLIHQNFVRVVFLVLLMCIKAKSFQSLFPLFILYRGNYPYTLYYPSIATGEVSSFGLCVIKTPTVFKKSVI